LSSGVKLTQQGGFFEEREMSLFHIFHINLAAGSEKLRLIGKTCFKNALKHTIHWRSQLKKTINKDNFLCAQCYVMTSKHFHHSACFINQCIDHESWQKSSKTDASRISESHVRWEINWWTLL